MLTITQGDLFHFTEDRTPVHCISRDCAMGMGIAVEMKRRFHLGNLKAEKFPDCLYYNGVLNLVTKERYFHKPTLSSLQKTLLIMVEICKEKGITKLVMPKIGCGLDRLCWNDVKNFLESSNFKDLDILVVLR